MKATWDKLEKNWVQFEVEVEAAQLIKAIDTAFRTLNQRVSIPGFRRGKAPRALFERAYGREALVQEAVEQLLPQAYSNALNEAKVNPIDQPSIDNVEAEEGKPFVFKGKVQVAPEVTLGKLSGFGVEKPSTEVSAEMVEAELNQLRERTTALVTDDSGEVKQGSFAVMDFEGFLGDEAFEGGQGENYSLEIGSGSFIPGFEEQLIGVKAGETREVKVTFPEEYHAEHLAGKEALFKVTVTEVKRKELPELNDEFAAEVSRFQTLDELKADITSRLTESAVANADKQFQENVVDAIAEEAVVELPDVLVSRRVHDMIHDFEHSLSRQGFSLELWHQATGKTHEDLHAEFDGAARKSVKNDLVLAAVAQQESITVTDADLEAEFDQMLDRHKGQEQDIKKLRKNANYRERMHEALVVQKTIDHLVSLNTVAQA